MLQIVPTWCHRVWVVQKGYALSQWSCCVSQCKHGVISYFLLCLHGYLTLIKVMNSVSWDAWAYTQNPRNVRRSPHTAPFIVGSIRLAKTLNNVTESHDLSQCLLKSAFKSPPAVSEPWLGFNMSQSRAAHRSVNIWHWLMLSQLSFTGFTVMLHHRFAGINSACVTLMETRESGTSKQASVLQCVG